MNIPKSIKVAGFVYEVELINKPFANNQAQFCDGQHIPTDLKIKLCTEGKKSYVDTVFLHELIHAIIYSYCSGILPDDTEENFTEQFAKGLYQVIVDNPYVFLSEAIKEGFDNLNTLSIGGEEND